MKLSFKYLLIFLLLPCLVLANGDLKNKYTKEKKIKKEFSVTPHALFKADNAYGNMNITTWNKNFIEVEITIKTSGNDEDKVKQTLDEITVEFSSAPTLVSAKTIFEKSKSSWNLWGGKENNVHKEVNYLVKMPVTNSVDLKNNYGAISLNRLEGNSKISCDYGKLILGELRGNINDLSFDYTTNSTIAYVKNATINADYSGFVINRAGKITLNADYTKSELKEVDSFTFNCDYGKINVGQAGDVSGKGSYVSQDFGTISKSLEISTDYGKISVENVAATAGKISTKSDFTTVIIGFDPGWNFSFKINLSHASFKGKDDLQINSQIVDGSDKQYAGYYGNKNTSNQLTVTSDFGGVTLKKN